MIFNAILVVIGGFFGAIFRYLFSQWLNKPVFRIPIGTLAVSLLGSFLLSWMIGGSLSKVWILLLGTGFMGAFTTFSTLNWESIQYQKQKKLKKMILYLGLTYTFGILLAFAGFSLGR